MPITSTLKRAPNGDWFCRKGIPADIRDAYKEAHGKSWEEIFRRPPSLPQARAVAEFRDWDAEISTRFDVLRQKLGPAVSAAEGCDSSKGVSLTPRQVATLVGRWYAWFVDHHENSPGGLVSVSREGDFDLIVEDDLLLPRKSPSEARERVSEIGELETFLALQGLSGALSATSRGALLDALRVELLAALATLRRRHGGDWGPDQRPALLHVPSATLAADKGGHTILDIVAPPVETSPNLDPSRALNKTVDISLSLNSEGMSVTPWLAFEAWVRERRPKPATINRWRSVFLHLQSFFPDRSVSSLTPHDAILWKNALLADGSRSGAVINDVWLNAARTVWSWLIDNGLYPRSPSGNPFSSVRVAVGKPQKLREREFNEAEWATILRRSLLAEPKSGGKDFRALARRWIPWVCAYTGARSGEIAQLRGASVRQTGSIWHLVITPEDGSVKGNAVRLVPLHEHLIEQGFLAVAQAAGDGPIFYSPSAERKTASSDPLKPPRPPYVLVRQKLGEWVRTLGVTDKAIQPNHAWRHTWKRRAVRNGIEQRIRDAICGHSPASVGAEYETPTLEDIAKAIELFPRYELPAQSTALEAPSGADGL